MTTATDEVREARPEQMQRALEYTARYWDAEGYHGVANNFRRGIHQPCANDPALSAIIDGDAREAALLAERDALAGEVARLETLVIGWLDLVTGPDEQGAYVHQRQLVEASLPVKARACVRAALGGDDAD